MYNSQDVAERIKKTAKEKKIIMKTMLLECGLGSNTMSGMYHGSMLKSDSLAKIADYLSVSTDYLLGKEKSATALMGEDALTEEIIQLYSSLDDSSRKLALDQLKWLLENQKK